MSFGPPPKRIAEQTFKAALAEYLSGDVPDDVRESVERLEMTLASPGDWEAARHTVDLESE